jgi:hypothetical protein
MSYAICKLGILYCRLIICGLLHGGAVYLLMNFVALPLAGVVHSRGTISIASRINGVLAVVLLIGLTISFLVHRNSAPAQKGVVG